MKVETHTPPPTERTFDLIDLTEAQMRFIVAAVYAAENRNGGPAKCSGFDYDARWQLYRAVGGTRAEANTAGVLKDGRSLSVEIAE